jgi:hypothetical protein
LRFKTWPRNHPEDVRKSQMMPTRPQVVETTVKKFYAAGFDALVKCWDKCISVGGGYMEKHMFFFQVRISYV